MKLEVQVQGEQYFPKVKNKALYTYVGQLKNLSKAKIRKEKDEGTIKSCLDEIAVENKRLFNEHQKIFKSLSSMVAAKELSKNDLIAAFIKFLPTKTIAQQPGESYLSTLDQIDKNPIPMKLLANGAQQEIHLLINALSIWVSTQQVHADELFDFFENN